MRDLSGFVFRIPVFHISRLPYTRNGVKKEFRAKRCLLRKNLCKRLFGDRVCCEKVRSEKVRRNVSKQCFGKSVHRGFLYFPNFAQPIGCGERNFCKRVRVAKGKRRKSFSRKSSWRNSASQNSVCDYSGITKETSAKEFMVKEFVAKNFVIKKVVTQKYRGNGGCCHELHCLNKFCGKNVCGTNFDKSVRGRRVSSDGFVAKMFEVLVIVVRNTTSIRDRLQD